MGRNAILLLLLCAAHFGCDTMPPRNFTGQQYPTSYSTIITAASSHSFDITISKVDGRSANSPWQNRPTIVDVIPGQHSLEVLARNMKNTGFYKGIVWVRAKEGKTYKIILESSSYEQSSTPNEYTSTAPLPPDASLYTMVFNGVRPKIYVEPCTFVFVVQDADGNNPLAYFDATFKKDMPTPTYIPPPPAPVVRTPVLDYRPTYTPVIVK